jgi:gluconolactonase
VPGRKKGLLYLAPNGSVIQVDDQLEAPNGLVLSPDERVLYAADSFGDTLIAFDVGKDGALTNRRPFGHLEGATRRTASGVLRSADGLAVDAQGRVYAATRIGVEVLSPSGQHLGTIPITGGTGMQNLAFAGATKQTLFVVGARAIWRIRMEAQGYRGRAK